MDKIEKALQRARELRNGSPPLNPANLPAAVAVAVPPPENRPEARSAETPVSTSKSLMPNSGELERNRVIARLNHNANADVFRMLRTKVLGLMTRHNLQTIAITSPNYGDGKTTVALNLALSLALHVKQTILLVDLDLRNPNVHEYLGIANTMGISDYIQHDVPISACMVKLTFDRMVVLPAGKVLENSSELLGTPKMIALAEELKSRYPDRIVIYDMPPLLTQDDTMVFLPNVDGVVLVVRDGVTWSEDVTKCMYSLENTNLIGTVLNDSSEHGFKKN